MGELFTKTDVGRTRTRMCEVFVTHSHSRLLCCTTDPPPLPHTHSTESLKERLSTAVFVRAREEVPAWGRPARACPYQLNRPYSSAQNGGGPGRALRLNQRPI
ncbi:unnamed protein product [Gadus morhua 'NCC']